MQTLKQKYADAVFIKINLLRNDQTDLGKVKQKKYGSMAMKMPILIHKAGLIQTLAFVQMKAKEDDVIQTLLDDLGSVLFNIIGNVNWNINVTGSMGAQLIDISRSCSLDDYMLLTAHASMALEWFKRFSQSVLEIKLTDTIDNKGE